MITEEFLSLYKKHQSTLHCIYFLRSNGDIVYIGSTKNPHSRIYCHTKGNKVFDDVTIMTCKKDELLKTEALLIRKHKPLYNLLVPMLDYDDDQRMVTVQLEKTAQQKLKAISDKRKESGKYPNKQIEILTDFINKLYDKECK